VYKSIKNVGNRHKIWYNVWEVCIRVKRFLPESSSRLFGSFESGSGKAKDWYEEYDN
jgi:hypothetical protein